MSRAGGDKQSSAIQKGRRSGAISTDPDEIRARIDAILAELPDPANPDRMPSEADLEELARQLSEAHDMLVQALESAEKA
jgi:DNA-binding transcriptional ArsR family regulator